MLWHALCCSTFAELQTRKEMSPFMDAWTPASSRSGGSSISRVYSGGSAGSNLGFRGGEPGRRALRRFRLEQGFYLDEGTLAQGGRAFGREASVGLSDTRLGTVQMGRTYALLFSTG
jgi:predicted porin